MKKLAFTFVLLITSQVIFTQSTNQFDKNGKRHGIWKKEFNNGRIRYQGEFKNGKEIGVFNFYSAELSDFPVITKNYNEVDNIADVKFFTVKGKLISKGKMEAKNRIGKWIYYQKDGKTIMQEENYSNGKLNGEYKTFYSDKKPTIITSYKNDKLHGNYKRYSIRGFLYQDFNYENGKLQGEAIYYVRKTGVIEKKGNFNNNEKVGIWSYYTDGELDYSREIEKPKFGN
jgi:antitoxin component YwqK of YwqJK toxin-antitoxin module